jgi:hypothetical protein
VTGPAWLGGLLAALMLLTAGYCVSRLVISRSRHRQSQRDADATHAVMGVAMAGMLATSLKLLPDSAWAVLFAAAGAWFAWRLAARYLGLGTDRANPPVGRNSLPVHRRHDGLVLLMCAAMVYMLLAGQAATKGAAGPVMGGTGGGAPFAILALALALTLFGFAVRETDRFPALPRVGPPPWPAVARDGERPLSPRLAACYEIAMAVTMAYMLVLML